MSIRCGLAVGVDQQILRPLRKAERRALQRRNRPARARRQVRRRRQPRERRLVAEAAGAIDRAEQDLQEMQHPAGLEAVGMGRDAAHGVHRHRAADCFLVAPACGLGPRHVERDLLLESGVRELARDAPDRLDRDAEAAATLSGLYSSREKALRDQREARPRVASVGQLERPTSAGEMSVRVASASRRSSCRRPAACRPRRARTVRRRRAWDRGSPANARW